MLFGSRPSLINQFVLWNLFSSKTILYWYSQCDVSLWRSFIYISGSWVCLWSLVLHGTAEARSDPRGPFSPWEPKQSPLGYFARVILSVMFPMNLYSEQKENAAVCLLNKACVMISWLPLAPNLSGHNKETLIVLDWSLSTRITSSQFHVQGSVKKSFFFMSI